jgi:lipopolysaccharide transport system ATP-binding protein
MKGRIASLLEVGTGFHPEMTGRENIYQNGAILGMTRHEITRKFDEIVDFSGCEAYIDTPVKRYSSGMYVRLAFAVAAHLESEILIVDEVLAVGDAEFQKKCLGKMNDVAKGEGRTVLFVSHNMAAVKSLCNKGVLLQNGKVILNNTIDQTVEKYHAVYQQLVNVFPKNRVVKKGNGNIVFTNLSFIDECGSILSFLTNGKKSIIEIEFMTTQKVHKNVMFWLQIKKSGELICTLSNELNSRLFTVQEHNKVRCEIDKLPLFEGVYTMSLLCMENGIFTDYAEDIVTFQIIEGNFYRIKSPLERIGIMMDHKWVI